MECFILEKESLTSVPYNSYVVKNMQGLQEIPPLNSFFIIELMAKTGNFPKIMAWFKVFSCEVFDNSFSIEHIQ